MREIKFRMWSSDKKSYFYDISIVLECLKNQMLGHVDYIKNGYRFEQFTGLKDKNGVEIYEGDVVESDAGLSGTIKFLPEHCAFLVYFKNENENCYEYLNCELTIKYMKVIGNIHEVSNETTM